MHYCDYLAHDQTWQGNSSVSCSKSVLKQAACMEAHTGMPTYFTYHHPFNMTFVCTSIYTCKYIYMYMHVYMGWTWFPLIYGDTLVVKEEALAKWLTIESLVRPRKRTSSRFSVHTKFGTQLRTARDWERERERLRKRGGLIIASTTFDHFSYHHTVFLFITILLFRHSSSIIDIDVTIWIIITAPSFSAPTGTSNLCWLLWTGRAPLVIGLDWVLVVVLLHPTSLT